MYYIYLFIYLFSSFILTILNDMQQEMERVDSVVTIFYRDLPTPPSFIAIGDFNFFKFLIVIKFIFFPRTYYNQYLIWKKNVEGQRVWIGNNLERRQKNTLYSIKLSKDINFIMVPYGTSCLGDWILEIPFHRERLHCNIIFKKPRLFKASAMT